MFHDVRSTMFRGRTVKVRSPFASGAATYQVAGQWFGPGAPFRLSPFAWLIAAARKRKTR